MRFASLGSGSKGNATLVDVNGNCLLVDCGFSMAETRRRLQRFELEAEDLTAILVTHEHGDHVRGVPALARRFGLPVYLSAGTYKGTGEDKFKGIDLQVINCHRSFSLAGFEVLPVPVPHDAREPCQYIFSTSEHRRSRSLGVLTDLGSLTSHILDEYQHCDALLLEANHDPQMLAEGPYPPSLKRRVGGDWGHLSNFQTAQFLQAMNPERLKQLVLGHLSETNNHVDQVRNTLAEALQRFEQTTIAEQVDGFDWISIG